MIYKRLGDCRRDIVKGNNLEHVDHVLARETQKFNKENQRIVELDLSGLGLDELSPIISQLDQLKVLNLSYNNLAHLPSELNQLKQLKILKIRGNPIKSILELENEVKLDVALPRYSITEQIEKVRLKMRFSSLKENVHGVI